MSRQVKCLQCGFFGIIDIELSEVSLVSSKTFSSEISLMDRKDIGGFLKGLPQWLYCAKGVIKLEHEAIAETVNQARYCKYFLPFAPGRSPEAHLETERDKRQRRFLILVSLTSAVVGATVATLLNFAID